MPLQARQRVNTHSDLPTWSILSFSLRVSHLPLGNDLVGDDQTFRNHAIYCLMQECSLRPRLPKAFDIPASRGCQPGWLRRSTRMLEDLRNRSTHTVAHAIPGTQSSPTLTRSRPVVVRLQFVHTVMTLKNQVRSSLASASRATGVLPTGQRRPSGSGPRTSGTQQQAFEPAR